MENIYDSTSKEMRVTGHRTAEQSRRTKSTADIQQKISVFGRLRAGGEDSVVACEFALFRHFG